MTELIQATSEPVQRATDDERRALASIRLSWAPTPDDVWQPQADLHVPGLHDPVIGTVMSAFDDARNSPSASPLGVVVRGQAGSGKTHLLGHVRERVQSEDGYFFLIGLIDASDFWRSTVVGMLDNLGRPASEHGTQLRLLLWRLATIAHITRAQRRAIVGDAVLDRTVLDDFVMALAKVRPQLMRQCRRTARALALYAAADLDLQDVGESFLLSVEEMSPGERNRWGIGPAVALPQEIARDISLLLAETGPTVLAVDQIDTLIAQSHRTLGGSAEASADSALEDIAHGLMSLRETLKRTVSVVSCTPGAWTLIEDRATATVRDRFRVDRPLKGLPTPDIARALLEKRFRSGYGSVGFEAPYPTWPVTDAALAGTPDITPRELLKQVDAHIRRCLDRDSVIEMTDFGRAVGAEPDETPEVSGDVDLTALDARFEALVAGAAADDAVDAGSEDTVVPRLLAAGLDAWIREAGAPDGAFQRDPLPGAKPALHARLRRTLDAATEDEEHWAFRAVSSTNAVASMNRIQKACTAAGLAGSMPRRRLFLLRNEPWSGGAKTQATVASFDAAGGRTLPLSRDDIRTLTALHGLLEANPDRLDEWLASRRPAHEVGVFRAALDVAGADGASPGPAAEPAPATGTGTSESAALPDASVVDEPEAGPADSVEVPSIPVGTAVAGGTEVRIPLEALRKHTAIFAGSGSGKTVLIRRLVEECALHGVSSIILDPNNDLSRLGTPWPAGSRGWTPGDEIKAADYLNNTEVLVWTPRRSNGLPLSFQPLPDFPSVVDDRDEFGAAIDSAVAALAPRARADGRTAAAGKAQAVLKQALEYFGRGSSGGLDDFVALLEELPEDISNLKNAEKIAADLAENLKAAMATDPMFGGIGTAVDPGVLLTPSPGRRARVSVVNLSGLPSDSQRQGFVNQLQMALFAWIKKNPAGDRPLGGLFVMDEAQTFAPSGQTTACTQSTLALASQARKYGLGLVFATQAPKGLNNRIPGNAATQFYGLLNSPAQIDAAKEMAAVKGGTVPDIGRLPAGQFYAAVEGAEFRKTQTPLCLTYHPKSPPTEEEVLELARASAPIRYE